MAIHPHIQKKVQQEIDEKTGRGHTPSVEECLKLEYLQATWKESLRMAPIVPIGQYFARGYNPLHQFRVSLILVTKGCLILRWKRTIGMGILFQTRR